MAELLMNENDIEKLVKSYADVDNTFVYKNGYKATQIKYVFNFYIDSKECILNVFIKKGSCNIMPCGNNKEECNKLIDYLKTKCIDANVKSETYSIECKREYSSNLLIYLKEEKLVNVKEKKNKDQYELIGYAGDIVHYSIFDKKLVIQGRALCVFGIIINYLSNYIDVSKLMNKNIDTNKPYLTHKKLIEKEVRSKINDAYDFVDDNLKSSLISSYKMIDMCNNSTLQFEDYTGLLTGAFKMLEGYLKKVLYEKYGLINDPKVPFKMFYVDKTTKKCDIDNNTNLSTDEKKHLKKLYKLFSLKRNPYLHGSGVVGDTLIITDFNEAKDILKSILDEINESYNIFKWVK